MKILIVLPVYNEQLIIEKSALKVLAFCQRDLSGYDCKIVIADNNSNDNTGIIGRELAQKYPAVDYFFTKQQGKGVAWRTAFQNYEADIYIVMDADLAVDLPAVNLLVEGIKGGADLALGSRYLKGSVVARPFFRDLTSVAYRSLVRLILGTKITDFQCGFKAINNQVKNNVLSKTKDNGFFLDTEITILSEKWGYKIKEVPVNWSEYRNLNRKSTVKVFKTMAEYLIKIWGLKRRVRVGNQ